MRRLRLLLIGLLLAYLPLVSAGAATRSAGVEISVDRARPALVVLPSAVTRSAGVEISVDRARPALVVLPSAAAPTAPRPLLIALHGFSSDGRTLDKTLHLRAAAIAHDLVLALPDGTRVQAGGPRFWNATDACCNYLGSSVDDVAYLKSLVDEIAARTPIDRKRVYVLGYSNGGFMAYRLACQDAAALAGIVVLSADTYARPSRCRPAKALSVLQLHGTADPVVDYQGGVLFAPYPSAKTSVRIWARYDKCNVGKGLRTLGMLDLNTSIAGKETTNYAYACPRGIDVQLWSVDGGTHSPSVSKGFSSLVTAWMLRHHR